MNFAESALLPRVHDTAHAQNSNAKRACGGAEILTHFLPGRLKVATYQERQLF